MKLKNALTLGESFLSENARWSNFGVPRGVFDLLGDGLRSSGDGLL